MLVPAGRAEGPNLIPFYTMVNNIPVRGVAAGAVIAAETVEPPKELLL